MTSKIEVLKDKIAQTANTKIKADMRALFNKRMHDHITELELLKKAIDDARMGGDDETIMTEVKGAQAKMDGVKLTLTEWAGLMSIQKRQDAAASKNKSSGGS